MYTNGKIEAQQIVMISTKPQHEQAVEHDGTTNIIKYIFSHFDAAFTSFIIKIVSALATTA